jgi:hypothetical protein
MAEATAADRAQRGQCRPRFTRSQNLLGNQLMSLMSLMMLIISLARPSLHFLNANLASLLADSFRSLSKR